jgi:plastocyanin
LNPRARSVARLLGPGLAVPVLAIALAGPPRAAAADELIEIVDYGYEPGTVTVRAGDVVTWTNEGGRQHTVTADDGSFDSGALAPTDPFATLFDRAGTFPYRCTIHPDRMSGEVVVLAAAATPLPSGSLPPTPPAGTLPPDFNPNAPAETAATPAVPATAAPGPSATPSGSSTAGDQGPLIGGVLVGAAAAAVGWLLARRRRRAP